MQRISFTFLLYHFFLYFLNVGILPRYYLRPFPFCNNVSPSCDFNFHILANNFQIYTSSLYSFQNLQVEFSMNSKTSISHGCPVIIHPELYIYKTQPIFLTPNLLPLHFQTKLMEPSSSSQPVYKYSSSLMLLSHLFECVNIQINCQFC